VLRNVGWALAVADDGDLVHAVDLLQPYPNPLVRCSWQVLPDVVGTDRQFSVATIDQHGQPDRPWPAEITQRIQGRPHRTSGEEYVVNQHHDCVIHRYRKAGVADRPGGMPAQIIPVHRDVQGARRNRNPLHLSHGLGETLRERDPASGNTEQHQTMGAAVGFQDLVSHPGARSGNLVSVQDDAGILPAASVHGFLLARALMLRGGEDSRYGYGVSKLLSMLVPLDTLAGWPPAPDPSWLQVLGLLFGLPLLVMVVVIALAKVFNAAGKGDAHDEVTEPVWVGGRPEQKTESPAAIEGGEAPSESGGAGARW
jgi:hypothetical protein